MKRVRLACLSREEIPETNTDFVYMEPGKTPEEIDETVDAIEYTDKIHEVMRLHHTQRNDYQTVTSYKADKLGINYFFVKD